MTPPEGLNDPTETRERYQFSEDEFDILHDLIRRVQVDGWAGRPLLHGTVPTMIKVDTLPAATAGWGRAGPIILSGTPDEVYACLRDGAGTWAWVQLDLAPLLGIDFLVGTATAELSAEIVAGTAPGGELGGTWGTPTVDATHSGSSHADAQAAAEATAAGALSTHAGAADPHGGYVLNAELTAHEGAADPHPTYTTAAELSSGIATHAAVADAHHTPSTPGWELIETGVFGNLGSELTTKTWSSLTYAAYRLTLYVNQITGADIVYMRLNGDTGANYDDVGAAGSNQIRICDTIAVGEHGIVELVVAKPQNTEEALAIGSYGRMTTATAVATAQLIGEWNNVADHITSITVFESGGGKFGSNTFYVLEGQGAVI